MCVYVPHLSGGKDEQEGPAAVERIREEHREAKGKVINTSESAYTNTYTVNCYHVPVFEGKGQGCHSVPLRSVFPAFSQHTQIIVYLQVWRNTQSSHSGFTIPIQYQAC